MEKDTQKENTLKSIIKEWETDRLILKPTQKDDIDILGSMFFDKNIIRYISDEPFGFQSIEDAKDFLLDLIDTYDILFTIRIKDNNEIIGQVGYVKITDTLIDMFYWIGYKYQNKGYASEAILKLTDYIFKNSTFDILKIEFNTDNVGSFKLGSKIKDYILQENPTYNTYIEDRKIEYTLTKINEEDVELDVDQKGTRGPQKLEWCSSSTLQIQKKYYPAELLEIGSKTKLQFRLIQIHKK